MDMDQPIELSVRGLGLLISFEVGGKDFYEAHCRRPVVPAAGVTGSGVTIGIGYDLGEQSAERFRKDWGSFLGPATWTTLAGVCGLKGEPAERALRTLGDMAIEWEVALDQFLGCTVPRMWAETAAAFPGVEQGPQCVREALLSLVFNRGPGMEGASRLEMRTIRTLVEGREWALIPAQIRAMKRLWTGVAGLRDRREAEARHIEDGLKQAVPQAPPQAPGQ